MHQSNKRYYVYILTNRANTVLYTGITSNLLFRLYQHRTKQGSRPTARYNVSKLVYYEIYDDPYHAISREKQIKAGSRARKFQLINAMNPSWRDLTDDL